MILLLDVVRLLPLPPPFCNEGVSVAVAKPVVLEYTLSVVTSLLMTLPSVVQ